MQQFGAKNEYGLGALMGGAAHGFVKIHAAGRSKDSRAGAAVVQIPRAEERKFDITRHGKFGTPSTAALVL